MMRLRAFLAARAEALEVLLGLALMTVGVGMVHVGAALIVAGAGLLVLAAWPTWLARRRR
ncbi:MAG: hypothetical protein HY727_07165 [Candidatus Rokubacteria bacterium]|nr:hypothetical protein [Candidatus Rokubacteria bacterium]